MAKRAASKAKASRCPLLTNGLDTTPNCRSSGRINAGVWLGECTRFLAKRRASPIALRFSCRTMRLVKRLPDSGRAKLPSVSIRVDPPRKRAWISGEEVCKKRHPHDITEHRKGGLRQIPGDQTNDRRKAVERPHCQKAGDKIFAPEGRDILKNQTRP